MARAAVELLSDPEVHARYAQAARRRAVREFSEERVMPLVARAYGDALGSPAAARGR